MKQILIKIQLWWLKMDYRDRFYYDGEYKWGCNNSDTWRLGWKIEELEKKLKPTI